MERVTLSAVVRDCRYLLKGLFLAVFILFVFASCAGSQMRQSPAKGVYHIVKKGETAYSIARAYSIGLQDLAEANNIIDLSLIKEDTVVFIPDADQVIDDVSMSAGKGGSEANQDTGKKKAKVSDRKNHSVSEVTQQSGKKLLEKQVMAEPAGDGAAAPFPAATEKNGLKKEEKILAKEKKVDLKREKGRFIWPVKGTVKTRFGIQPNKTYHNNSWIKIVCPAGTKVKAAAGGTVIYSTTLKSSLKSFGETIIIRHDNGFATVYTHLKKRYVTQDQNVKKGQVIALVGEVDETGDAYINFEIRHKSKPRDPLFHLP